MAVTVKVEGLEAVVRKLKTLPLRVGKNAVRRSLRKGANVVRDQAKNNARRIDDPATREAIYKNISVASGGRSREKQAGGVMMRVGVRGGARFTQSASGLPGGNTSGYWRFVELGTSQMPAHPFMRPALAEKWQAAGDAIVKDLNIQIDREIAKLS